MGEAKLNVFCRFCDDRHRPRFLCDPAKRILEALIERGMSFNMPTIEFPEPIDGASERLGLNAGDQMLSQVVAKAAVVPVVGTFKPAVILTGRTPYGVLPQWMYAADDDDLRDLPKLIGDITQMAIRAAVNARAKGGMS